MSERAGGDGTERDAKAMRVGAMRLFAGADGGRTEALSVGRAAAAHETSHR